MTERGSATDDEVRLLRRAIELARASVEAGGRPFGAVVVRDGEIVADWQARQDARA